MNAILTGIVVAVAIAIGTGYVLPKKGQHLAWKAFTTSSVRVGDPGHNLVGSAWTGLPSKADIAGQSSS
jgi:hypothetical protein